MRRRIQVISIQSGFVKIFCLFAMYVFCSCQEFLSSIDDPNDRIKNEAVFNDDVTANSAVLGIYANLLSQSGGFARGDNSGLLALTGLSSDELNNFSKSTANIPLDEFQRNNISAINTYTLSLWSSMYKTIYMANSAIEGLEASKNVTPAKRNQLMGEAIFLRTLTYFYLVNLFGDVPLILTTDYQTNSSISRDSESAIYSQMISDLVTAKGLMDEGYASSQGEKIRANKVAATALLARIHLFSGNWVDAETQASIVLAESAYKLVEPNSVFLKNNQEAILQLKPNLNPDPNRGYTWEGLFFSESYAPSNNVLTNELVNSFELDDKRRSAWIAGFNFDDQTIYRPTKYKSADYNAVQTEYSTLFRLAELYLIRAEAKAQQNKLSESIDDLDEIRERAGLSPIAVINPGISQDDLLLAIEQERRAEFFTEWGHRWLDLKRTGRAVSVLSPLKTGFTGEDELYPIPQSERNNNSKLTQNPGY